MKRYIITTAILIASTFALSARNCGPTLQSVKIGDLEVSHVQDQVRVDFTIDFSDVELGTNQQVIYTPVLTARDGSHSVEFGKIVLNGRNISLLEERSPKHRADGVERIRRVNGTTQTVAYSTALPYSPWMEDTTLYLSEDLCGCGDLMAQSQKELMSFGLASAATDTFAMCVEPAIEQPKIRNEKGSASVDFVVDEIVIRPDYRNNRAEINKILATIDVVRNDKNVEITGIDIHGYASPEDTYEHNSYLAENRTKALTEYIKGLYDIPAGVFTLGFTPEDWAGLREYVAGSDLKNRRELLEIIDDPQLAPDTKDWRMKLRYSDDYDYLLTHIFPGLRRSDYTISYIVRPFTAEEALKVMKSSPKQVSLYEMFWAAQSLGVNSDGYKEVIKLAVETYPDEPVANYNAAAVAVNNGDCDLALRYLEKVPESAETLNIRGVAALSRGDISAARDYFRQSAEKGLPEASKNLKLIEGVNLLSRK